MNGDFYVGLNGSGRDSERNTWEKRYPNRKYVTTACLSN